ncbi:hypothetical protein B0H14DRAFT_3882401 [Mycena olivaceomarginata]|nr:hypothetical protein B0H14DRAFT_3882401 [Mycena olivaceomarginata]
MPDDPDVGGCDEDDERGGKLAPGRNELAFEAPARLHPSIPARQTEEKFQSRSDLLCLDYNAGNISTQVALRVPHSRASLRYISGSAATSRVARHPNTGDYIRMAVTTQYARQTNCHAPPFAVPPSHEAAMKSCGPDGHNPGRTAMIRGSAADLGGPRRTAEKADAGAKWTYLSQSPTRAPCVSLPPLRLVVLQSPLCSLRSTPLLPAFPACDYLPVLRAHIASIVFYRPERDTHESTPAAIDAAFSHSGPFSIHGVAPATRLSLGTRLHIRCFSFYASSSAIMRARSPIPTLASKKAQACTPAIFRSTAAHSPTAQPFRRPSSTPSTPTALELFAARTLQRDGSTCDLRHALEAATRALWHARPRTTSTRSTPYWGARTLAPPSHVLFLAAHAAFIASSRTATLVSSVPPSLLEACTCCAPRHHRHHLLPLQRVSWPFPIPGASFIASSCAKLVYNKQDSTRPRARFRASPTRHRPPQTCSAHAAAAPQRPHHLDHLPAVSSASPPSDGSRLLSGAGSTVRSTTGMLSECGGRSPTPNAGLIAFPRAVPILCADAGLRSETPPPAHSDVADRTTMQRDSRPGFERVAPPLPLGDVDSSRASYTFMRRGAIGLSVGATSTAPPVSALGASLMIVRPPHRPVLLRVVVAEALRVQ